MGLDPVESRRRGCAVWVWFLGAFLPVGGLFPNEHPTACIYMNGLGIRGKGFIFSLACIVLRHVPCQQGNVFSPCL